MCIRDRAFGKTSVTSVVADTAERAPKGSYKRNYATGFDGWIDEITLRKGGAPDEKAIKKIKSLVDVWRGPKFNGEDWEQGNTPEGFNIRYAGSVSLFKGGSKLGLMSIKFKKDKTLGIRIQVLKNPDRGNQIIEIGKIDSKAKEVLDAKGLIVLPSEGWVNETNEIEFNEPLYGTSTDNDEKAY